MSNLYLGQIVMAGFNFAPSGTAFCNGEILQISQNTALFGLIGTNYGGDGVNTFALPNLQGCIPVHQGEGPGLSFYDLGQSAGTSTVTLSTTEIPLHSHSFSVGTNTATTPSPSGGVIPAQPTAPGASAYAMNQSGYPSLAMQAMSSLTISGSGGAHNNMMPTLFITFIITLIGIFPSRS
jgi:microcystin-dependent protein